MRTERCRTELATSRSCKLTERARIEGPAAFKGRGATRGFLLTLPKGLQERGIDSECQSCTGRLSGIGTSGAASDLLPVFCTMGRALVDRRREDAFRCARERG